VRLDRRDLRVSKEKPDPKAHRVSKERLGLREILELKVYRVFKVKLVLRE
jgi:hypothetical protein